MDLEFHMSGYWVTPEPLVKKIMVLRSRKAAK